MGLLDFLAGEMRSSQRHIVDLKQARNAAKVAGNNGSVYRYDRLLNQESQRADKLQQRIDKGRP